MVHRNGDLILNGVALAALACCLAYAPTAAATVIAQWRFEPDNPATPENEFLADSSGNGNTLANFGVVSQYDPMAGFISKNSALFDGNSHLHTTDTLNLSPYQHIRVSWWQKVTDISSGIVWEHSQTFINTPGSIVVDVNDAGNLGLSKTGVWGVGGINLDDFTNSYDSTWEHMAVEFDLGAAGAADVVRPFRNGNPTGSPSSSQTTSLTSFLNDTFYIGARGGSSVYFDGNIDELTIESIPAAPVVIPPIEHQAVKLYVLGGQSNMVGQYAPSSELPPELQGEQTDVVVYAEGKWTTLHPGIRTATPNDFGPEITFGRAMADSLTDESVVLVKYALGATTLAEEWNSTTPGTLYAGLLDAVQTAVEALSDEHDVEIAGMLWMQGESDALDTVKAQAYETNFQNFVDNLRGDLGVSDLPIAVGQIADDPVWVHRAVVRQAVTDVIAINSNIVEFSTDALPTTNHHYNTQGQMQLGNLFADALGQIVTEASIPEPGTASMLLSAAVCLAIFRKRGLRLLLVFATVFSLALFEGLASTAAAKVDEYHVAITKQETRGLDPFGSTSPEGIKVIWHVPQKYSNPESSGLTASVPDEDFKLELTTK